MRLLFFDLEFAAHDNGEKICEFGYVITDENFNLIKRENILINPNIDINNWDLYVIEKILTKPRSIYYEHPMFDYYYEDIKKLILEQDYVFGFSTVNDVMALNDELKRYHYDPLTYNFYDVQKLYAGYIGTEESVSLINAKTNLLIKNDEKDHDAEADAYNTMLVLKAIISNCNTSLEELIKASDYAKDVCHDYTTNNYEYNLLNPTLIKTDNNIKNNKFNNMRYLQLIDNVSKIKEGEQKFKKKKVYISDQYTNYNYIQTLNLIQLITNEDGEYTNKSFKANIFVRSKDSKDHDDKMIEAYKSRVGDHLKVIEFEELLNILNITEDEIDIIPSDSFFFLHKQEEEEEEKEETNELFASFFESFK